MKQSKHAVHYSRGMPSSHCGICEHFQPPHACALVEGSINPDMWCELFKKAPTARVAEALSE